ncbi:MAG: PEP-CTERM sorting domain-containing protein [Geobacter sp.]|nr:MAG: PEP-CTERM sorting domain-containing protein [Geobacter sp.]
MKKLFVIFLVLFSVGTANANLINNGDFSTLDITGWTLTGGEYSQAGEGFFREFDNSGWAVLSQNIVTTAGMQYDLSFDTYADYVTGNEFAWSIDGGALNYITSTTSWITNYGTFSVASDITNVAFYMATDPGTGTWRVDNISVTASDPAPVPEPTTFLLLGAGLVGMMVYRRKGKK